ncbi:MAG: alpha/beta hydrolase [Candidatus Rokuibacteriota bacterium]|nr:MAG: alpha/beta hydrolase [Candidatus Rokubacteria bacterium]
MATSPEPVRITRRSALGAAAAGTLMARGSAFGQQPSPAQPAPRVKGPRVWLDLDQAELDAAYDQSAWAPNREQMVKRYATNSEGVRARLGAPQRFAYGATPVEGLDVYVTRRGNAPINIFIHGGAWRLGLARNYAFPAELFVRAGAHFVVPDFAAVQDVGGSLMPMAAQVRAAVAWVKHNAQRFGGDPDRIYVSGHSSGAHLAGVILTTDWRRDFNLPADTVKGGLCCSGMYDLKPVRLSARNAYVKFTDEMEQALSSQRHLDTLTAPVIVACGTLETPEFQRQARDFAAAVTAAGKPVQLLVGDGYNHFEIIETLTSPYGLLGRAVLEQMKLTQGGAI